jgi:hypothetical protein
MSIKRWSVAGAVALAVTGAAGGAPVPASPASAASGCEVTGSSGQPAPAPAAFTFNGAACTGTPGTEPTSPGPGTKPPTVTLTSPAQNPDLAWGHDLHLAASASDADGVVTRVEFLVGGDLLAIDTTAPYEFTYTVTRAPGGFSVSAKAYDNDGLTATSQSISAFVFSPAETIVGVAEPAVEIGCWSLVTDAKRYLLLGGDRTLITAGARLQVRGTTRPDMLTTCQQDTPFLVYSVQPA